MFEFLSQHQFSVAVALYWIFSAAISSMPEPTTDDAPAYSWLYRFLHTVAGNITTAFGNKIPGATKMLAFILVLPLAFSNAACAAVHYTVHPGALNQADSISYDTLLIAETAIDEARHDFETGRLPNGRREAFETLVSAYNLARQSWLTYRGALEQNLPETAYLTQLNQNLANLSTAIRQFLEVKQ